MFFKILSAIDKYSLLNRDNLTETILIQLRQKQKAFSELFLSFLKFILMFQRSEKIDDPHS